MNENVKNNNTNTIENINEGFTNYLKDQNIKAFYEFDKFEFMSPDKNGLGLGETNVYVVEKEIEAKNGKKITIFEFYKDGINIANSNEKGEIILTAEYKKQLKTQSKEYYEKLNLENRDPETISKEDLERRLEQEEKSQDKDKKQNEKEEDKEENKELDSEKVTKKEIEEEFGDKYVVAAEINDEQLSDKLCETESFVGNPSMAYNKETKEFVLIGKNQNGKLKEATMTRTNSVVNVNKYNNNGTVMEETTITGMIFLSSQDQDALSIEMNEYGEVEINKVVNARSEEPQLFPVDTKQTVPTTKEIDEMKQSGDKMEEIQAIIEEMQTENLIDEVEADNLIARTAKNGNTLDEDKAMLEQIAKQKQKEKEEEQATIDDDDDGLPPMADPFNPNNRSRW